MILNSYKAIQLINTQRVSGSQSSEQYPANETSGIAQPQFQEILVLQGS